MILLMLSAFVGRSWEPLAVILAEHAGHMFGYAERLDKTIVGVCGGTGRGFTTPAAPVSRRIVGHYRVLTN